MDRLPIRSVRAFPLTAPLDRVYWWATDKYKSVSRVAVEVTTEGGPSGWGLIQGRPMDAIVACAARFGEAIAGMDAMAHGAVWRKLFALTSGRAQAAFDAGTGQPHFGSGARPQMTAALAGIDLALWDIKGKATGMPAWRLLGAEKRDVWAYASGGYYVEGEDNLRVADEVAGYADDGFDAAKIKVGGVAIDEDLRRLRAIRDAVGPDMRLMLDANNAYSLDEATEAIRRFAPLGVHWFEEPIHWYDGIRGLARLRERCAVDLASGESELDGWRIRDLVDLGAVRYVQYNATRSGGATELMRIAAYADLHGLMVVPHHEPAIHAPLVAAMANGLGVEVHPDPRRDPFWTRLFAHRPERVGNRIVLSDRPGLGIEIDPGALAAFAA